MKHLNLLLLPATLATLILAAPASAEWSYDPAQEEWVYEFPGYDDADYRYDYGFATDYQPGFAQPADTSPPPRTTPAREGYGYDYYDVDWYEDGAYGWGYNEEAFETDFDTDEAWWDNW